MQILNKQLKRRIIDISFKHNQGHIGSCLTAVDIIKEIYDKKKPEEKFVLSSGHAGLALYVVLEDTAWTKNPAFEFKPRFPGEWSLNAERIFDHHGVHPDRCEDCGLDCSAGSLGHGIGISVGMALADRNKTVYCLISDGESAEGSVWEALRVKREQKLENLTVYLNFNNYAAYKETDLSEMPQVTKTYITNVDYLQFLNSPTGQNAHYHAMSEEDYKSAMEILK